MKTPEPQFRPIPLTIVDLIAIFSPGFLWLVLFITAFHVLWPSSPIRLASPARVLEASAGYATSSWLAGLATVILAALIGYALKPLAMEITERLMGVRLLEPGLKFMGHLHFKRYAARMKSRWIRFCDLKFPFDCLHDDEEYEAQSAFR